MTFYNDKGAYPSTFVPTGIAPKLLWEWNGQDVSQFGNGLGAPTFTDGGTITGTLTAQPHPTSYSSSQNINRLYYTWTGGGTQFARAWYLINDLPVMPDRYIITGFFGQREASPSGIDTSGSIVAAFQDLTHHFSLIKGGGAPTSWFALSGNGDAGNQILGATAQIGLNLNNTLAEGNIFSAFIEVNEPSPGIDPAFYCYMNTPMHGDSIARAPNGFWSPYGGATSPSASWDAGWYTGGTMKDIGFKMSQRTTTGGHAWFGDLKIWEW